MIISSNKALIFFILLISTVLPTGRCRADAFSREYRIKAGFMVNFIRFSSWPESRRPAPGKTLRIGVCGNARTARIITLALAPPRMIAGHQIQVKAAPAAALLDCHLVFFAGPLKNDRRTLLPLFRKHHVLTVGESDNFLLSGGIINFSVVNQRIVFDINQAAALNSGIHLNAKILQVARTVTRNPLIKIEKTAEK